MAELDKPTLPISKDNEENNTSPKVCLFFSNKQNIMLYLINCTVHRQRYMGESSEYEKNHIVDASSEEEAQKKT